MSRNRRFWSSKKSCTSCPNWGWGVIWTKSKRTAVFFSGERLLSNIKEKTCLADGSWHFVWPETLICQQQKN